MVNIYYVDPTASGDNDGTTEANAWQTLQRAIDGTDGTQPVAGDTVYCYANGSTADETITASIDVDGNEGTIDSTIKFIGVNSSGVDDGTPYIITGDSGTKPVNILMFAAKDYTFWKNFTFSNASGSGIDFTSGAAFNFFNNVQSNNNGAHGFDIQYNTYGKYYRCAAIGNSSDGFYYAGIGSLFAFCIAKDNTGTGIIMYDGSLYGCLLHYNARGCYGPGEGGSVINCVFDGNTGIGFESYKGHCMHLGNRYTTNGTYGLDFNLKKIMHGYNYYQNNTTANQRDIYDSAMDCGGEVFASDGADASYNARASDDFNLVTGATLKGDTYIELPE